MKWFSCHVLQGKERMRKEQAAGKKAGKIESRIRDEIAEKIDQDTECH